MSEISLAIEDILSRAVIEALLAQHKIPLTVSSFEMSGGNGYLRRNIRSFNHVAHGGRGVVLATDLDNYLCPGKLIQDWLSIPKHSNLLICIPVRSIESWILADRQSFADFFSISLNKLPQNPEIEAAPKRLVTELARKSRNSKIRLGVPPKIGSTASMGRDYNSLMLEFIRTAWKSSVARKNSHSLNRAIDRLSGFRPT